MSTLLSSDPTLVVDSPGGSVPKIYVAGTTACSSAILTAGYFQGYGFGSRGSKSADMTIGSILLHVSSTDSATPGRVTCHSVIGSSANVASTVASSGYSASYDITVSASTT